MNNPHPKPGTTQELVENLAAIRDDLGKGGRRLAGFLIENLGATALMSSTEVAERCGVHASSVVRLAQGLGLSGYRELQAIAQNGVAISLADKKKIAPAAVAAPPIRLRMLAESGASFNDSLREAARQASAHDPLVDIAAETWVSHEVDPVGMANTILAAADDTDGLILVAREHPAINNAVRTITGQGVPVICLTSDLPTTGRTAYVGADQFASGSMAGWLCGRFLPRDAPGRVLFVCSVPFRCQLDREQGFRQVLRSEFPALEIDERVSSDESADVVYDAVRRYVSKNGPPAAIYNVSGANLGIGRALEAEGLAGRTVFVGHELNSNSRALLERGVMDVSIGHDFGQEVSLAIDAIRTARLGQIPASHITNSQVHTRHNCAVA